MRGLSICFICLLFVAPLLVTTQPATAGSCLNTKSGKCPVQKKKHDTRAQFTATQREKMAVEFRKLCKKKYGSSSRLVKIDYYKRQYVCSEPGY
jgi:hypothetical protein